jgi:hypothetical protein
VVKLAKGYLFAVNGCHLSRKKVLVHFNILSDGLNAFQMVHLDLFERTADNTRLKQVTACQFVCPRTFKGFKKGCKGYRAFLSFHKKFVGISSKGGGFKELDIGSFILSRISIFFKYLSNACETKFTRDCDSKRLLENPPYLV